MTGIADSPQLVPRVATPRDKALPLVIAVSLLLHVLVLLPLLRRDRVAPTPIEIPVELVQAPEKTPVKPETKPAEKPPATPAKPPEKTAAKSPTTAAAKPAEPPEKTAAKSPKAVAKSPPKAAAKPAPKPPAELPRRAAKAPASRPASRPAPQPMLHIVPPPAQPPRPGMSVADQLKAMLGPMPAVALPGASADGSDDVSYSQLVLSKLAKAKKEGRYRGIPGNAGVEFSIGDHGEIVRLDLVAPSGDPTLDGEAIAMVKRAAPYPPPPPGGRRDYAITLRFRAI